MLSRFPVKRYVLPVLVACLSFPVLAQNVGLQTSPGGSGSPGLRMPGAAQAPAAPEKNVQPAQPVPSAKSVDRQSEKGTAPAVTTAATVTKPSSLSNRDPVEIDYIVATVGSEVITRYELNSALANATAQLKKQQTPLPPADVLEKQMLDRMITDRVQLQYAKENGIKIDDNQVDQALGRIAQANKLTLAEFRAALVKDNIPYAKFREQIRDEMTIVRLREREVDSRLVISDGEIDNYLANPASKTENEEYHIAHILLRAPESATPEQLQKLKQRADEVINKLRGAQNFAELAAAYSDAPDALQGGDLGWRRMDRLPIVFTEALEKLKPGEVSPVLRSANGFHIVRLVEKRGGESAPTVQQTHARHILVKVDELLSEKEAEQKLLRLKERVDNGGDFALLARQNSQDASAPKGGDLGWIHPGDTVPDFERAMDALKPGETSQPVRSPFGWHLIQVLERRTQDVSNERKRQNARQILRERKLDEAYQDWIRQLRDQAFIEIRLDQGR